MQQIGLLATVNLSGTIGYDGKVPWYHPEDIKRKNELTKDSIVIIGRKTYESSPISNMPNCIQHILTYQDLNSITENKKNAIWYNSFDTALKETPDDKTIWILGGGDIFRIALLFYMPDFIDLTIVESLFISNIKDSRQVTKEKTVKMPSIPYAYFVEHEIRNENDPMLTHRRYVLRKIKGHESSFINQIKHR